MFTLAPMLAAATPAPEEDVEEEILIDWDRLQAELAEFRTKFFKMFLRVLGCTSLKRLLEAGCLRLFSAKTADRLIKDPAKSALRKAARLGRPRAALGMLSCAARAQCLTYAANLLVEEVVLAWRYRALRTSSLDTCRRWRHQAWSLLVGFSAAYVLLRARLYFTLSAATPSPPSASPLAP